MNNYLGLYLLTRLDGLNNLFTILIVISGTLFIASLIARFGAQYDKDEYGIKIGSSGIKIFLPILIVSSLLLVSTPTKNEAIFIVAGGKTINFIQNDTSICKLPAQTAAIISNYLDKQIKEIETTKQK